MSIVSFVSKRLSLNEEGSKKLSPAIVVAISGVALSFCVMMLSIAVVGGFKNEITRKIMGFDSQLSVFPIEALYSEDIVTMDCDTTLMNLIKRVVDEECQANRGRRCPEIGKSASVSGIIKTEADFAGVVLRGTECAGLIDFAGSSLTEGSLPSGDSQRGIAVSKNLAVRLALSVGDKVDAYFIDKNGTIRPRKFEIEGIYSTGFGDYDNLVVFAPLGVVGKLLKLQEGECEKVDITGLELDRIEPLAYELQGALSDAYAAGQIPEAMAVNTVLNTGAAYFNWLALLDTNVVVILILMGCVSGLMLVTCVIILILQRVRTVGIFKALGATDRQIGEMFLWLGGKVILTGLLIGNVVSLLLIAVQWKWQLLPLDPESYYLTSVPVEFSWSSWLLLNAGVVLLSGLLMLVPSGMISRLSPVKTLRFE